MTITRETLELAALACGYEIRRGVTDGEAVFVVRPGEGYSTMFYPHEDDDDNINMCDRLTIGCGYKHIGEEDEAVFAYGCREFEGSAQMVEVWAELREHNNDRGTARRYATTMVAAEIGRRMKEPNSAE